MEVAFGYDPATLEALNRLKTGGQMPAIFKSLRLALFVAAATLLGIPAWAKDPSPVSAPAKGVVEQATVEGFRSARFGMQAKDVRDAIKKDFGLGDKDVIAGSNPEERTQSLTVKVKDLLPDSPPAAVSYIFGATSKKLIQVNVGWGSAEIGMASLEALVPTANTLRDYFIRKGMYAAPVVANQKLPDGSILVFRGIDDKGRMALLQLKPIAAEKKDGKDQPPTNGTLLLAYIEDPKNPDVFRLEKGKF